MKVKRVWVRGVTFDSVDVYIGSVVAGIYDRGKHLNLTILYDEAPVAADVRFTFPPNSRLGSTPDEFTALLRELLPLADDCIVDLKPDA